jgi:hypothetical protein
MNQQGAYLPNYAAARRKAILMPLDRPALLLEVGTQRV